MDLLDQMAESRIAEAQRRGEFERLPGAGKPLRLDDDRFVPATLRSAYRLLRNAGFVPPELERRRQIRRIEDLLRLLPDEVHGAERRRLLLRLTGLRIGAERYGLAERLDLRPTAEEGRT